jgi:hypothetical protein
MQSKMLTSNPQKARHLSLPSLPSVQLNVLIHMSGNTLSLLHNN